MAPIYTARHVSASDKTTPLFALKGLSNLAPTTITLSGIHGVPLERQVAYTQYAANLASFIKASLTNAKVIVSPKPLGYLTSTRCLPLSPPPVHMTLQKEISHDSSEKLLRLLGPGASKNKTGNTTIYQAPAFPVESLEKILPLATTHFNSGRDALNPMGLKAFTFISSAFAEILRVHSYSAFTTESDATIGEFATLLGAAASYRKFPDNVSDEDKARFSRHLQDAVGEDIEMDVEEEEEVEKEKTLRERLLDSAGYTITDGKDTVLTAKPPRHPAVANHGHCGEIPQLPGLLFPYFHGLTQPDQTFLTAFTLRHLFQLLGSTVQECQETYAGLRRGFNSLSTTDVGMVLTHIGFGIDLAITTQSRCFVIIEANEYKGFTLLGARLAVFDSTKWHAACGAENLRADLNIIDPHKAAVGSLVSMFGELSATEVYKGPAVSDKTFSDPKDLVEVFQGLDLSKIGDQEKELNRNLRCLNYMGDGYIQRNPQTLVEVLETMLSDAAIELSRPTFISSIRAPLTTREYIMLSRFGPEAPSFWNERGQEFPCVAKEVPASNSGKRKMGDLDSYANLPSRILVSSKPLEVAVRDMGKVVERGAIRMDLKERAGKNRNMSVESENMRKQIWKVLVDGLKEANVKKRKVVVEKKATGAVENFDDALNDLLG